MIIVITSQSALKNEAVKTIFSEYFENAEFLAVKAASDVPEQPFNDETLQGARNRITHAKKITPQGDIFVSIESGLFEEDGKYMDHAVALILNKEDVENIGYSAGVEFPSDCVNEAREKGFDTTTVGKIMQNKGIITQHDDPHKDLSGISRKNYIEQALKIALTSSHTKTAKP